MRSGKINKFREKPSLPDFAKLRPETGFTPPFKKIFRGRVRIYIHFDYNFLESTDISYLKTNLAHFYYDFWESPDTITFKTEA